MRIPVLIEPVAGNGFRARSGEPLPLTAEGSTRQEALQRLHELFRSRIQAGAELTSLEVGQLENPWARGAGMFKENPLFEEWQQAMAENRRREDEEPEAS